MSDSTQDTTPRIRTVSLEDQGITAPNRHELTTAFRAVTHVPHNRCQHEARTSRGIFRQCRNKSVTTREGQRLCARHAYPD